MSDSIRRLKSMLSEPEVAPGRYSADGFRAVHRLDQQPEGPILQTMPYRYGDQPEGPLLERGPYRPGLGNGEPAFQTMPYRNPKSSPDALRRALLEMGR